MFDSLENLQRISVHHEKDQPSHSKIKEHLSRAPKGVRTQACSAPNQRFCPTGACEYPDSNCENPKELDIIANAIGRFLRFVANCTCFLKTAHVVAYHYHSNATVAWYLQLSVMAQDQGNSSFVCAQLLLIMHL